MAENDNIHDDIREIRGLLLKSITSHTETNTKLDALLDREIPALWEKAKAAESCANQAKAIASKTAAAVKNQRLMVGAYAGGAAGAYAAIRWCAAKLGIHIA